ncbi:MAG: 16S rRNA (guanine(527)-N(7))-methyltransferase RsmG [Bacilli bacterium]|nr:16S rRNA (guanine(527)-N(7))-methyltransferase RsmG [Bacilli bacterium]
MTDFSMDLKKIGIEVGPVETARFKTYFDVLVKQNQVMNLTRITEEEAVYKLHFLDSLSLASALSLENQSILDVGSGAGFPSLPLKIVFPKLKVTIVDSLGKRIKFLEQLTQALELDDVELVNSRIEDFQHKAAFDIVTARAVARMNILVELCLPFVRVGGYFIAMKATDFQAELDEASSGIVKLGGKVERVVEYELETGLKHVLLLIKKVKESPNEYPRVFGKIKKKPL